MHPSRLPPHRSDAISSASAKATLAEAHDPMHL